VRVCAETSLAGIYTAAPAGKLGNWMTQYLTETAEEEEEGGPGRSVNASTQTSAEGKIVGAASAGVSPRVDGIAAPVNSCGDVSRGGASGPIRPPSRLRPGPCVKTMEVLEETGTTASGPYVDRFPRESSSGLGRKSKQTDRKIVAFGL
jgi:hypothetical protein